MSLATLVLTEIQRKACRVRMKSEKPDSQAPKVDNVPHRMMVVNMPCVLRTEYSWWLGPAVVRASALYIKVFGHRVDGT